MQYSDFIQLCSARYACRAYSDRQVSRSQIEEVLEAARIAPSAKNRQPWRFIVLESEEDRICIRRCYDREWISAAPVYIVICADHSRSWRRADGKDHADVDLAIAGEHIALAAAAAGLGTCWVCNFDAMKLADDLSLPEGTEPVAILPLGYPAEGSHAPVKTRKPLDEIVKWGK